MCLSVWVTLGLLGLLGVPINLISSLFVAFVFGCGVDYSVFLLANALGRYRGTGSHTEATCGSVMLSALTTLCGFVAMMLSRYPTLFSIGVTGAVGMSSSLAFAFLLVPGLTRVVLPADGRHGTPSLKTLGGALWAYAYLGIMGLAYLLVLRPIVFLRHRRRPAARQRFARRYLHVMAVGLLRGFPYRHSDRIYINPRADAFGRPAVIVSNHLAGFDTMVVLALPVEMAMTVRSWVWNAPIMGRMVRDAGYVLTEPGEAEAFLRRGAELLAQGVSVMLFPEGTRSPDGRMQQFHKGAFELAVRTGSDVVPVLLSNTEACTPRGGFWIGDRRGRHPRPAAPHAQHV